MRGGDAQHRRLRTEVNSRLTPKEARRLGLRAFAAKRRTTR